MIGVVADSSKHFVIGEFFELFKTPWELYRSDRQYDVVLCAEDGDFKDVRAKLILIYAGHELPLDAEEKIEIASRRINGMLSYMGDRIPIYGDFVTFREGGASLLVDERSQQAVTYQHQSRNAVLVRIGYDLFNEVSALLTIGQCAANAGIPTLDLHVALLRNMIVASGVLLIEIPPVPAGYKFIACLTHDVDHPSILLHKWDHTIFGFLYRAVWGSLVNFIRGRIPLRSLLVNWAAALKLPFVYMGLATDFWQGFEDRYLELEKGLPSTFFVVPFKNQPGKTSDGRAPRARATRYAAKEIAGAIGKIIAEGCEVGLHGIDAWVDSHSASKEFEEIRRLTGISEIGARMHWLYYDQQSPASLEEAGATYDSTIGYRETVGYRAGTTQVYKPLNATRLLELPLHIMDTALFYPAYLGLSSQQATPLLSRMVDNAARFGGCITINWHDRSLAPERIWNDCYVDLIQELKNRGAWFATAGQATSWFRKRRSIAFGEGCMGGDALGLKASADRNGNLPDLQMRTHKAQESGDFISLITDRYVDMALDESLDDRIPFGVNG